MRRRSLAHLSTRALRPALALAVVAACHKDTIVTTRVVTAYVPEACKVGGTGFATYTPLGDFDAPAVTPGPALSAVGTVLAQMDPQARELVVSADLSPDAGGSTTQVWAGVTPVAPSGDVSVMILPQDTSCALTTNVKTRPGATLAPIGTTTAMLVGSPSSGAQPTYVAHLDTGVVVEASPDLPSPPSFASVTAFGEGALVAGGAPSGSGDSPALATAAVYSTAIGGFDKGVTIALSEPRAHHGAVVLSTGQTLLVGGSSDSQGANPIRRLDLVDPTSLEASEVTLALLVHARRDPVVLQLTNGNIFVAGGFDDTGAPVPWLEWFNPKATSQPIVPVSLAAGSASAFIAMPGGAVLAVVAPPAGAMPDFPNTWFIGAHGELTPATPIQGTLTRPVLLAGAGGAPLVWTGDRWLQWQPWAGAFGVSPVLDKAPATLDVTPCSPDPGLALWLDEGKQRLVGLRVDTRNPYSPLPGALLAGDTTETAPDQLPGAAGITFTAGSGLTLPPDTSAFVTDRTYADVSVSMTVPTQQPARVVLSDGQGNELEVGGVSCPGLLTTPGVTHVTVVRRGASVTWAVPTGPTIDCGPPPFDASARVSVGVRGPTAIPPAVVNDLVVTRLGSP